MAIIARGEELLSGEPNEAIRSICGRVWRRGVSKTALDDYKQRLNVLSTRLVGGRTIIHALSDSRPDDGFEPVGPNLEDVYFGELRKHAARAA
jgi:hypothetical protein